ncbi:MAG: AAA family ATPase, partial [Clostridium sp.]
MNLINNRYRIIANLSQDRIMSSYLVSDIINNYDEVQLNIISSEFASQNLIDFYVSEFKTLEVIKHANICKVFDFGLVHTIDNQKVDNEDYFYTNEYIKSTIELKELLTNIKRNDILDIFVQLCMAVNYLHIIGFIYGDLNANNILISPKDDKYSVVMKDLATIEIENHEYDRNKAGALNFKAPENILDNKTTIASDIFSIGVFLLSLCEIDVSKDSNIDDCIEHLENEVINNYNENELVVTFYKKLVRIIKKMTNQNLANRYNNLNEVVKDINELFDKNYISFRTDEIQKLNFNTKIVGRNGEISKIMNGYENLVQGNPSNRIIAVQGEQGIGKTRLLKEIKHLLYMKKANVYSSFVIGNSHSNGNSNKAFIHILKKIVSSCDEEIVKRYQSELIKFIPELGLLNNVVASESLTAEKEKYRLISRVYSFIRECIVNKPTVFIIDNAHWLDDFSMELLGYMNAKNNDEHNVMVILSISNGNCAANNKIQQLFNNKSTNLKLSLKSLDDEETAIMIQQILRMPSVPIKFGESVYKKTYGNPLFIEETLKDSVAKKILYINKNNGKWFTPFNYDNMPIASTMEQALSNQIKEINEESLEVLSVIAIFNTAVSVEVIEKFFIGTKNKTEFNIEGLYTKGILSKKIEDMGFVFDFSNKGLKNLIYNRLSEQERNVRHEFAASVLEIIFENEGRENKEELIYHLEKANDKHRIVKYCIELAEKMKAFRLMDEAISKYNKALSMLSEDEDQNKKVELLLKIGDIYSDTGNLTGALETYIKTYAYSVDLVEVKIQVDTVNKIADICMKRNEVEKALEYIKKGESLLLNTEYMEGYLENKNILAKAYTAKQEYDKVFNICTNSIKKCGNAYIKYKGLIYNILGVMYSETSRPIEALECYRKGLTYFEEINFAEGMCRCLNNLGVIYGDHYHDNETAISYYNKFLVIAQQNNILDLELIALVNLATCYSDKLDYAAALKYFKDILEKSKDIEFERNIFYIYNYLSFLYVKMGNNNKAHEYFLLAQKELEEFPIQGRDISIYYQMRAEFYYGIGDIDASYDLIIKALNIYNNDGTTQDNDSKLLLLVLEIQRTHTIEDMEKSIKYIKEIVNGYKNNKNKVNALYEICIAMHEKGYGVQATSLFELYSFKNEDILGDMVNIKKLYLEGLICIGKSKITSLMLALDLSKKMKNKSFQWRICSC